jgi:hypothetical protein
MWNTRASHDSRGSGHVLCCTVGAQLMCNDRACDDDDDDDDDDGFSNAKAGMW